MNTYDPDEWVLVRIGGSDPHYKIFGSWRGGYLSGDSWRMNSGITDCEEFTDYYIFKGHSGSEYYCWKNGYGIRSSYNISVLLDYQRKLGHDNFEIYETLPDLKELTWLTKN